MQIFQIHTRLVLIGLFLFSALAYAGEGKKVDYFSELESLSRLDFLPAYRTGCVVEQFSSYDRTGGNDDGFNGTYSYLRKEGGKLVIAEMEGPGIINRIWTPTPTNDTIEFYFDGRKEAGLKICFNDLFSGKVFPFVSPVCGHEVGGYYCYLPIPYKKSCKVVFTGEKMLFYQLQYRNMPGYELTTFSPSFSVGEKQALDEVCNIWNKRGAWDVHHFMTGKSSGCEVKESTFVLQPDSEQEFFALDAPGRIVGFEINGGNAFEGLNKDVFLNAVWDDEPQPAINAPLADFFGYAYGKPSAQSMLLGCIGGVNYCYLPCPFDKQARMKLQYKKQPGIAQEPVRVSVKVYYNTKIRDIAGEGKLYTFWHREINPLKGKFYDFLSVKGKGHYVGTIHQAQGLLPGNVVFFEGDDVTTVDGKMRIHGTGSEDYYNGGWYDLPGKWDGTKSLPIHGCLDYNARLARTGGYRFYLTDKLSFENEFYMGIEHGPEGNAYPVDYTSVAFYYAEMPY